MNDLAEPRIFGVIEAENRRRAHRLGAYAILAGVALTIFQFLNQCTLLGYAPGSAIRPMDWASRSLFLSFAPILAVLPLAVSDRHGGTALAARRHGSHRRVAPLAVMFIVGRFIIAAQQLILEAVAGRA